MAKYDEDVEILLSFADKRRMIVKNSEWTVLRYKKELYILSETAGASPIAKAAYFRQCVARCYDEPYPLLLRYRDDYKKSLEADPVAKEELQALLTLENL